VEKGKSEGKKDRSEVKNGGKKKKSEDEKEVRR